MLGGGTVARAGDGEPPWPLVVGRSWGGDAAGRNRLFALGEGPQGAEENLPALAALFTSRKCTVRF